ncbi:cytochrome P450 4g15 isoform X2 [Nilaparvata lugens]|nr:cytochrome P450 4g15 isoform X2 [Nilaparvata lugens]
MLTPAVKEVGSGYTATFLSLLFGVAVALVAYYRMSRRRLYQLAADIPGPTGYPLLGNALEFVGSPNDVFTRIVNKGDTYKNMLRMWIGPRLLVFIYKPDDVEVLLSSSQHINKGQDYDFFRPWLGNGLLISGGDTWRRHRKLIAPTFHLNILKSFIDLFNANSRMLVTRLKKESATRREFDVHDYMSECTVETLLETVMGLDKTTQNETSGYDYAMAVMKVCDILHLRHTKMWLRPDFIFNMTKHSKEQDLHLNTIHSLTTNVMNKKKENYFQSKNSINGSAQKEKTVVETNNAKNKTETKKKTDAKNGEESKFSYGQAAGLKDDLDVDDVDFVLGEKKRMAFLDLMIQSSQDGNLITDKEIKEQVDTIMFEGHDTTAAATSFFMCLMGCRPDIQEKCLQEVDSLFGDSDRYITFEDTLELKYLERCIMETLRLFPPVPLISRQLEEEMRLSSCDVVIPKKTTVVVGTYRIHRREDIYPNPDHFDPDNFLPERSANRHYYSFIPFSAGPRSCVGRKYAMLKLKVILATVLRYYKVLPGLHYDKWKLQADIILKRTDGFMCRIESRRDYNAKK